MKSENQGQRDRRKTFLKVALVEPEIPSNTGNIGRTCVAFNSFLELVGPLGFQITAKELKRAGLDYWPHLNYKLYKNFKEWEQQVQWERTWLFSTKGRQTLCECRIQEGDTLVFGKETRGLPQELLDRFPRQTVRIPFSGKVRSLNLSNAVAITLFEAFRQNFKAVDS